MTPENGTPEPDPSNAPAPAPEPRPDPAEVYRLIQKRASGEPLRDDEKATLRAYWKPYQKRKMTVHMPDAKIALWKQLADERGLSDSEWVQQMVDAQLSGDPRVQDLERRMADKEAELANVNRMMGKFAQENGELHGRLEGIESNLLEANEALRQALGVRKA